MKNFTEKIITIIRNIPVGQVATYGQVARLAGNPRAARQVSRVLHSMSAKYELPWHRVVNARGEIVVGDSDRQLLLLEKEDVVVDVKLRVDLGRYQWSARDFDFDVDWMEG